MDIMTKLWIWIKSNILISLLILLGVTIVFFPKLLKGLIGTRRVRHHRKVIALPTRRRRTLPRSVGMHKVRKQYTEGGKVKKPWQIKGSEAARRHMAKIRRMR
jgi:hypothetical protein